MIKVIDIPKENDVDVEISKKEVLITVYGKIKLQRELDKSISVEKKDHKLILSVPSDEKKYLEILNSTVEHINKLFKMTLHPYFNTFGWADFPGEKEGWIACYYPFRAAVRGVFDTPERMINACNAISKQLLTDGFIPELNKTWDGKDVLEINGNTITLLTESGYIYFRPKIHKNKRKYEKIKIEFRDKQKVSKCSFCDVSAEWEYFTYFKEYILPIFKKTSNEMINLCALAPPNYDEKPLYYQLIQFLYYPDGKIEDDTIYCTKGNEYKNEYGFKSEILNMEFEEWDGAMPDFDDFGAACFPCKANYKGAVAGLATNPPFMITLRIISENSDEIKNISRLITQRLIRDEFVPKSLGDYRKDGNAFIPKELGPSKLIGEMEMEYKINDNKYIIFIDFGRYDSTDSDYHYNFLEITSDWNDKIFRYMKTLMDSLPNNLPWRLINLMAWAPPDYKEKPLYYPLIDITRYPDGTAVDKTVYVTKKNEYKEEIGFKPEIIERKFKVKRESK